MNEGHATKIWFLHALRGIASLLVVIAHLVVMFWHENQKVVTGFKYIEPKINHDSLFYFSIVDFYSRSHFRLGPFGVALFFLISGFVISLSLQKSNGIGFLVSRFFRIYPTYIIGFTITFFTIYVYTHIRGVDFPFGFKAYAAQILLIRDWLWLPSIDGVSWTLETEIKFYVLIWIIAISGKLNSAKTIVGIALLLGLMNVLFHSQYDYLLANHVRVYQLVYIITYSAISLAFMLAGVCLYNYHFNIWTLGKSLITILLVFLAFISAFFNGPNADQITVYGVNYSLALLVLVSIYLIRDSLRPNKLFSFLADISYPLYIVHGINGYILLTVLDHIHFSPYISLIITIAIVITIAYLLHRFVEIPSNRAGKKLAKNFETFTTINWRDGLLKTLTVYQRFHLRIFKGRT